MPINPAAHLMNQRFLRFLLIILIIRFEMGIISQIFLVRQTLESIVFPDGFLTRIFLVKR